MEKVKLMKEQAEAIEHALQEVDEYKGNPDKLLRHASMKNVYFRNELHPLNSIDTVNLAKALYIGYEVEPEFKVGDWIHDNITNRVAKIDERGYDGELAWVDDEFYNFFIDFRHATPEEIAAEKERRWWAKHGREVWELREGDILFDALYSVFQEVLRINGTEITWFDGDKASMDYVKERCKVVCFAENRMDKRNG